MRRTRHLRGLIGSLFVLPLAMAGTLMSPGMVTVADGCSGAAPYGAGWTTLEYKGQSDLPVDGVIVFSSWLSEGTKDEDALSSVTLSVKDAAGQGIPGTLLLSGQTLMWRSDALLNENSTYDVSWEVEPGWSFGEPPKGTAQFTTTNKGASFPDANFDKVELTRVRRLTGALASCTQTGVSSCGPYTHSFGSEEITPYGVEIALSVPTTDRTYQEIWLERVVGKGALIESELSTALFAGPTQAAKQTLTARFVDTMETYCVNVVRRDLRNDSEIAHEVCVSHEDITLTDGSLLEEQVYYCDDAPDLPALLPLWCQNHASDAACAQPQPPPGSPPLDQHMKPDRSIRSSGCAFSAPGPTRSNHGAYGLLALGAALVLTRRRRRN